MRSTFCPRVSAFLLAMAFFVSISAFGEEPTVPGATFSDYKDPALLLRNYVEMKTAKQKSGDRDPDTFLVKGMMYYFLDILHQDAAEDQYKETFDSFKARYTSVLDPFAGLKEFCPDCDAVLKAILAAGMIAYFRPVEGERAAEAHKASEFAKGVVASMETGKASHLLQIACSLLRGTLSTQMSFATLKRSEGPPAMFILCGYSPERIIAKRDPKSPVIPAPTSMCISLLSEKPLPADGTTEKAKVQGIFHAYPVFTQTPPLLLVEMFIPDEGAEGWSQSRSSWIPVDGYSLGPILLHSFYCDTPARQDLHSFAVDIEGTYIDEEVPIYARCQVPQVGGAPFGSYFLRMLMRSDHLERPAPYPSGSSQLRDQARKKYTDRLASYRPYLAARYQKTVRTTITISKKDFGSAKQEFLTPDYSCKPEFFAAILPDDWVRIACYCGLDTVANFNVLGLDDPRPIRPKLK